MGVTFKVQAPDNCRGLFYAPINLKTDIKGKVFHGLTANRKNQALNLPYH
jgi:hypothetical protein